MKWKTTFSDKQHVGESIESRRPILSDKQRPASCLYAWPCYHIALYHHLLLLEVENSLISTTKVPRRCILYHFETPELLGKLAGSTIGVVYAVGLAERWEAWRNQDHLSHNYSI